MLVAAPTSFFAAQVQPSIEETYRQPTSSIAPSFGIPARKSARQRSYCLSVVNIHLLTQAAPTRLSSFAEAEPSPHADALVDFLGNVRMFPEKTRSFMDISQKRAYPGIQSQRPGRIRDGTPVSRHSGCLSSWPEKVPEVDGASQFTPVAAVCEDQRAARPKNLALCLPQGCISLFLLAHRLAG